MGGLGPLVRTAPKLLRIIKIDAAVLKSIRRHLRTIKSIDKIALRSIMIQRKAFDLMNRLALRVGTYSSMERQCSRFNRYVAELLIVRDYDLLKDVAPIEIAYRSLALNAHHIVKGSEFKNYAQQFQLLAKKVGKGWWTSEKTMPAMALFEELHGLSPEALKIAYKMETSDLDLAKNFSKALDAHVLAGKKTGSFAELFELHRDFYRKEMNERFYKGREFDGLGGKSLDEWFDDMIALAKEIDKTIPSVPPNP